MAGTVFLSVTMSLDGSTAPESVPVDDFFPPEKQDDPDVQRWMAQRTELQQWLFPLRFFRKNLKLGAARRAATTTPRERRSSAPARAS